MSDTSSEKWRRLVVSPAAAMERVTPGMSIFLSTGAAEPRTLVRHLMASEASNLADLELIQLVSLGEAVSLQDLRASKYRLKTFFQGWVAGEAITEGRVDLIPCRFASIPRLIETRRIPLDAAFVQITPPDEAGYCSLGVSVDAARQAMEQATLVVGEINPHAPRTYGDTFVSLSDFDLLVEADEPPIHFPRPPVAEIFEKVAARVAGVIEDGSCLGFSIGPVFEALARHLARRRRLGIHSPFFTDALMELVQSGAVTNRQKPVFRGKSVAAYAHGTAELMAWLDRNPLVEFQGVETVLNPLEIGRIPRFVVVVQARRTDLSGSIALPVGRGMVAASPGEVMDFIKGAELSPGGRTVVALPSRNRRGESKLRISLEGFPNQFLLRESVDWIVTEYGVASLTGRTVRERAQALIEIAHPDDRPRLVEEAKAARILYADQIFLADSAHLYPAEIDTTHAFHDGLRIRFRAIRPSDEEEMRRLFYRFSDEAVYYRFFAPLKTMPHAKMQQYVNVDYRRVMSVVGLVGEAGSGHIVAEARFVAHADRPEADVAFVVDESVQGRGVATFLLRMLARLARERGLRGFTADVLASNKGMMKVFERGGFPVRARLEEGVYALTVPFGDRSAATKG